MKRFFEWALQPWLRRVRGVRALPMGDAELVAALAQIPDNDPRLRALLEVVHDSFETETKALLTNNLGQSRSSSKAGDQGLTVQVNQSQPGAAEYQRGRAASLYALLDRIEAAREDAREAVKQGQQKETARSI